MNINKTDKKLLIAIVSLTLALMAACMLAHPFLDSVVVGGLKLGGLLLLLFQVVCAVFSILFIISSYKSNKS